MATEIKDSQALEDFIPEVGVHYHIHSDNAQMETSKSLKAILREYNISCSTTEPYHHQKNPAECKTKEYKKGTNIILDCTEAPIHLWFHAIMLWVGIINVLSEPAHKGRSCLEMFTGYMPDISHYTDYTFYDPVYYYDAEEKFPSTKEQIGHWLGPTKNCGDALTYWILTEDDQILARCTIRTATGPDTQNHHRNAPFCDEGVRRPLTWFHCQLVKTSLSVLNFQRWIRWICWDLLLLASMMVLSRRER